MKQHVWVAGLGVSLVFVYSSVMALQALVLDPLAAVPGQSVSQIYAHLLADSMNVQSDVVSVIVTAGVGVALALTTAIVGVVGRLSPVVMSVIFLAIIVLGAGATFSTGFALGLDVADSYGVGGGAHTIWAGVLYWASLCAVGVLVALFVTTLARDRRKRFPIHA